MLYKYSITNKRGNDMEVIICTLVLVILVLWYKFSKSIKDFRSEKNSYLEKIKKQQESLAISQQQYASAKTMNYEFEREIQTLKKQLNDARKELEFYKNIEEDSGDLNIKSNSVEYNQLIEQAAQQIRTVNIKCSYSGWSKHNVIFDRCSSENIK